MPRWIAAVVPPGSWRSPPYNPLFFGETARIPARILAVALNVRGATGREPVLVTLGASSVPSCRLSTSVSRGVGGQKLLGPREWRARPLSNLKVAREVKGSAAQNMDVIDKRANNDLNVRAVGPPSRQKTGNTCQVYEAMRSTNVKSRCLSNMRIRPCGPDG